MHTSHASMAAGSHIRSRERSGPSRVECWTLSGRSHRSLGYFPFVRPEGCQDFILFTRRYPEVIERASQLSRDLIELLGGDVEVAMGLFQPEGGTSRLRGREREGSAGDVADPQGAHELQPRQSVQLVGMPLTKLRVLRCLADDGVLDDRVAEKVDHRSDGEHATQSVVQARLSHRPPPVLITPSSRDGGV